MTSHDIIVLPKLETAREFLPQILAIKATIYCPTTMTIKPTRPSPFPLYLPSVLSLQATEMVRRS